MYRWFAWNILFRLHEAAKGHQTYRILREMETADRLSEAELQQLGQEKTRSFLDYCYTHVPYVRRRMQDAGIQPSQIRTVDHLRLLPLMRKEDIRENREELRSRAARNLATFSTGGSTGEPLIFDIGKRRVAARVACRQRVSKWWGISLGDSELALWGSPIEVGKQQFLRDLRDRLLATRLLSAFEMNEPTMTEYLDIIERARYKSIFAYPSAIYLLSLQARKQGRDLRQLGVKVIFVTGEVLFPYQRELIAATFNCPVANWYGGRDSGCIANECPQGGMHILADSAIVEAVDAEGRPVPPGTAGEIAVTDLYSEEAPFIRYLTGDIGAISTSRCSCGRALPLLERIEGRSNDLVLAPDGRLINSLALVYPVREIEGIDQYRITQKRTDRFHVEIVRNERFPADGEERIRRGWTQLLRAPLHVTFEYLPALAPERSGKFRHVVSELSGERGKAMENCPAISPTSRK
jgi:phenylacetate-CoA ligase